MSNRPLPVLPDPLLTVDEASKLGCGSTDFIRREIRVGRLIAIALNAKHYRIRQSDLYAWLDARRGLTRNQVRAAQPSAPTAA